MTTPHDTSSDSDLWPLVLTGDAKAFEVIVSRYKNLLCSVAYSRCGDFTMSEDVAQDAFWAAWESRDSLREPERLRSWLCGIVRNMVANQQRKSITRHHEIGNGESLEASSSMDDPAITAISREEENLVWQSLEEIPETYREPLILFYREERSVAEVAMAMELSEDAVKQRLSRGRSMLRDRMADVVEGALRQTRPTTAFTVAVMAGVATSLGGKTAMAGSGMATVASGVTLATIGKVTIGSVVGGLFGAALGIFGGYLGLSVPAIFAPTRRERDYLMSAARRTVLVSLGFVALLLFVLLGSQTYSVGLLVMSWNCLLMVYILVECFVIQRGILKIRAQTPVESDPNLSSASLWLAEQSHKWERRHYCSHWKLLGIPLFHLNAQPDADAPEGKTPWTTGWIAIGDKAQGVIAFGGLARGGIAIGGLAYGIASFGGVSLGLLSFGGLSIGLMAFGGAAVGVQAFGGLALGASLAAGGQANSLEYSVGAVATAPHTNDDVARAALAQHELVMDLTQWGQEHPVLGILILILSPQLFTLFMYVVNYRRRTSPLKLCPENPDASGPLGG